MSNNEYHKYVFDQKKRKFKGDFEEMYKAEKANGFDSWEQDDVNFLDKQLCVKIIENSNFNTILDVGCGKGALTHLMKKEDNLVFGLDLSPEAVSVANERYRTVNFFTADVSSFDWVNNFDENTNTIYGKNKNLKTLDCIVCLETLSYIHDWQRLIREFSEKGRFSLIKLFLPNDPIGYIKTNNDLVSVFENYFKIIEHVEFFKGNKIILFGKSKLIEEK